MSLVLQITDTHVLAPGELLYGKTDSAAHLAKAIDQINAMRPRPDVVLVTGDLVERPDATCYRNFIQLIEPLQMPVYVLPGNHDCPATMAEIFSDTAYFPASDPTFQYAVEDFPFRILALNSHSRHSQMPEFDDDRLAWLERQLEASDKDTLIAIHHPPMTTGIEFVDMVGPGWFAPIASILSSHEHAKLVICGHSHMDMSGRIAHVPVYMAPSTSHQLIADRGLDLAPWYVNQSASPVVHQFIDGSFRSGSCMWPESMQGIRIDEDSGYSWDALKEYMRGRKKLSDPHF